MKKIMAIVAIVLAGALLGKMAYTAYIAKEKGRESNGDNQVIPGIYQHYKGEKYTVVGVARFSEDPHKEFVIYTQNYDSLLEPEGTTIPAGSLWARPKDMFIEVIEHEGKKVQRFKRVE